MALVKIADGRDQLLISKPIVDETLTVLQTKFDWEDERLAQVAGLLARIGESLATTKRIQLLKDDPDDRILEARSPGAQILIVSRRSRAADSSANFRAPEYVAEVLSRYGIETGCPLRRTSLFASMPM